MGHLPRRFVPIVIVAVAWTAGAVTAAQTPPASAQPTPTRPAAPAKPAAPRPNPEAVSSRPRADAASPAIARGQRTFGLNCAFCHGADARGGAQGGSDLLQSPIVLEDEGSGVRLAKFLPVGRPEKNMPPFDLPRRQVSDIAAFLQSKVSDAAAQGRFKESILVGDAKAGAAYFNGIGKCSSCHRVDGDLKGIGAKYDAVMLQGRMVVPRGSGGYPGGDDKGEDLPLRAAVTPTEGEPVSGDIVYLSDFYISVRDASGRRHTFIRRGNAPRVEIEDPLHGHLALLRILTDKDMHDLTAYLATLK